MANHSKSRKNPRSRAEQPAETATTSATYHHGALHAALLEAAETILRRDGILKLTLRGVARQVGVSHAAPKNHFDDMRGLLSELAAVGFARLAEVMQVAAAQATDADTVMSAIGRAYVQFARANTGLFLLMYRSEMLDFERPALKDARATSSAILAAAIGVRRGPPAQPPAVAEIAAAWSLVHGFAMLLIDRRLAPLLDHVEGADREMALLDAVLASVRERKAKTS
jgi:AcrR family transcriptional regulator